MTTPAINTTGADFIVLASSWYEGNDPSATATVSDSKSNTWTAALAAQTGGTRQWARIWYSRPSSVGASHTFTLGSPGGQGTLVAIAWSGSASSPADQHNSFGQSSGSTTIQPGSITPSQNGCLIIAMTGIDDPNGATPESVNQSFTIREEHDVSSGAFFGNSTAYLIQGTAAAVNPTFTRQNTSNGTDTAAIASFLPSVTTVQVPYNNYYAPILTQ